jgi:PBSX family phage terminase large subunit
MKMQNHMFTDPTDNFLITSPTYKILSQSTLPPYLRYMEGFGEYKKADAVFKIHGGGTVYFRTGTDPDSIVGITNVRAILCDEVGLYGLYFFQNIQARAAFRGAKILGVTSPYSLGWLFKDIIKPKSKDPTARPDVTLITARSDESPHFPKEVYERNRLTMDPRRFNMVFGGKFEQMAGLVYDCFDENENTIESVPLPTSTRYFGGIDWGYTEPFVLVVHAITLEGRRYQVSETYKSGLTISAIADICTQKHAVFGVERFYCDPSQPASIEELNRIFSQRKLRCSAVPANNDIRMGIDYFYELVKTRQYKIIRGSSPHTVDEFETYHYPEPDDLGPDQKAREQNPVGQNDHAMDANRYVSLMTKNLGAAKLAPITPEEHKPKDSYDRIRDIKRKKTFGEHSEKWS